MRETRRRSDATRLLLATAVSVAAVSTAVLCGGASAAADNPPSGPNPAVIPPAPAPIAMTLTTIPAAADGRTDLVPTLLVRTDNRAVESPDAADPGRKPTTAPTLRNGVVAKDALTAAAADAKTLAAADMGVPQGNSESSTLLDFLGATPDQDVHLVVYSSGTGNGLTDQQKANRGRFDALCKKLRDAFVPDH